MENEEKNNDTSLENDNINRTEKRIRDLSEKVKLTSQEKEELAKAKEDLEKKNKEIERERDFYASFADSASSYPEAKNHKDEIKAKVMSGYSVEDATIAVLAKQGKFTPQAKPSEKETIVGGSADTTIRSASKPIGEMTREEKRQALSDAFDKGEIRFG